MSYARYFKADHKVTLRVTVSKLGKEPRFDSIFGIVDACNEAALDITFPPPFDHVSDYPFTAGQKIEVLTDRYGMGISARAEFLNRTANGTVQLKLLGDLMYFNRRRNRRVNIDIWLGLEKSSESIAVMRGKWSQMAEHFRGDDPSPHLVDFCKQKISLSSTGLGLHTHAPVKVGECFMIFMALDDKQSTICILGEIVRTDENAKGGSDIGVHFDCIEEDDRQRIEKIVRTI